MCPIVSLMLPPIRIHLYLHIVCMCGDLSFSVCCVGPISCTHFNYVILINFEHCELDLCYACQYDCSYCSSFGINKLL